MFSLNITNSPHRKELILGSQTQTQIQKLTNLSNQYQHTHNKHSILIVVFLTDILNFSSETNLLSSVWASIIFFIYKLREWATWPLKYL